MYFQRNNYCNLLNITYAILGATTKFHYDKIDCIDQSKEDICKNVKLLFKNTYVIPSSSYINIVHILQTSLMNVLECNNIEINKVKTLLFNYQIIPFIIIGFIINIYFFRKLKNY